MIAASFWSLLDPAITMANNLNMTSWLIVFIGFFCGGLLLFIGDKFLNIFTKKKKTNPGYKRIIMLISSITLHNIPEGLVVGVAFGSIIYGLEGNTIASACLLALGIGLQNFPEGTAVSLPIRREGISSKKAFIIGCLSGIVEPISGVIGALVVLKIRTLLPFLLSFAAGAMIYVVVEEIIPESQTNKRKDFMALFTIIGFSIMMILDVALG
jgi:ZIP family zinc transporter